MNHGTSGDEPFAIQVFGDNTAPPSRASIEGRTTDSWIEYSTSFTAPEQKLSVILRKNSPGVGTMLFDSISLSEIGAAVQRFRNQPQMFSEVITTRAYAVFEVTSK